MFHTLRTLAERDVVKRVELRPAFSFGGVQFEDCGAFQFSVSTTGQYPKALVVFSHDGQHIHVESSDGAKIAAGVTFTHDGKCKLKVGQQELAPWQVLRLALEPLLF
jgi:hypothetical protein